MNIKVNSNIVEVAKSISLKQWLEQNGYNLELIAVECNKEIVRKMKWEEFLLEPDMSLEIVEFVGGG